MKNSNGKGSRPRNNASSQFRDNYEGIFKPVDRRRQAWQEDYRNTYTWEEFKNSEECEECGYWSSDGECHCRGMGR
jgi:hypothetical protein